MHTLRVLFIGLTLSVLSIACGAGDDSQLGSDGEDAVAAEAIASGADRARPFVAPNLDADEEARVLTAYAHLDPGRLIAPGLLHDAVVYYDVNKSHLSNPGHMAVVDFELNSGTKRFFLIDMHSGAVTPHAVAHGAGSDDGNGNAVRFSNTNSTHESSLGFVLTAEIFSGTHGRSLRLDGLSSTNSNMRARAIIVHGAAYVHESAKRQGHSWGCFALDFAVKDAVLDALHGGALLYANLGDRAR
jgi:hypothetical protein